MATTSTRSRHAPPPAAVGMLTAFLALALFAPAAGAAQVVVPNGLASVPGNSQFGNPLACPAAGGERYQQVYRGAELGSGSITAIAFRREEALIFPDNAPVVIPNVIISLSSTPAGPDGLSATFASNVGPDVATVFNGTVTSFTTVTGPGLKPFDTVVELATPFPFDATAGKNLLLDVLVPECPAQALISFDVANVPGDAVSIVRSSSGSDTGFLSTRGLVTQFTLAPASPPTVLAAVLPSSRVVQVGQVATAFASMIAAGAAAAIDCRITPANVPPGMTFSYQETNAANDPIGSPNAPVSIPGGESRSFVLALTSSQPLDALELRFDFACANTDPAAVLPGVNTLMVAFTSSPGPDIVALAATVNNDGIVDLVGTGIRGGAFASATVNLGTGAQIFVTADTGSAVVPVQLFLCETEPSTGLCQAALSPPGGPLATQIGAGETATFGVFVQAFGDLPFLPGVNRVFLRFKTGAGETVGATSVALRTP